MRGKTMKIKIKMCGLKREADIACVNEVKPDFAGFIFAEKSHRYVTPETAAHLKAMLDPAIKAVGVFVNKPEDAVAELVKAGTIDVVQLHGKEDEAYIQRLRGLTDAPVIQAFRIDGPEDVERAMASSADLLLLDHGAGGTGEAFDWRLIRGMGRPFLLAGGLGPDNVQEALRMMEGTTLQGVDVSSGIETDKVKDPEKMRAFAAAVRSYEAGK